jgi:hypothetical protein
MTQANFHGDFSGSALEGSRKSHQNKNLFVVDLFGNET